MQENDLQTLLFSHLNEYNKTLGEIRQFMGSIMSKMDSAHDDRIEIKAEIKHVKEGDIEELKRTANAFREFRAKFKVWGTIGFLVLGFFQAAILVIFAQAINN